MKKLFLTVLAAAELLIVAELHYIDAKNDVYTRSDFTDASIEQIMHEHGFDVDAIDTREPSYIEKISALFTF